MNRIAERIAEWWYGSKLVTYTPSQMMTPNDVITIAKQTTDPFEWHLDPDVLSTALATLTQEDISMNSPAQSFSTISPPADHREAIGAALTEFRETEKSLIAEIQQRLSELGNVQHAIVSYQALFASLAEPVAPAKLSPVPMNTVAASPPVAADPSEPAPPPPVAAVATGAPTATATAA